MDPLHHQGGEHRHAEEKAAITFGGKAYQVEAFTFAQLERLMPVFARTREPLSGDGLQAIKEIIAIALGIEETEVAAAMTTLPEMMAVVEAVARVSGLEDMGKRLAARKAG